MFSVQVPAKLIIAGEHAVLRGGMAITLPHPEAYLELSARRIPQSSLQFSDPRLDDFFSSFSDDWSFPLSGFALDVRSTIPEQAGMGSSAALCVAVAKFLRWAYPDAPEIRERSEYDLAVQFEHYFHGQSSGMDVAAVQGRGPRVFVRSLGVIRELPFQPFRFLVVPSGEMASTKSVVEWMAHQRAMDPNLFIQQDQWMAESVRWAERAFDSGSIKDLIKSFEISYQCFESWGLVTQTVREARKKLLDSGALAVRLMGKGKGGCLLALVDN